MNDRHGWRALLLGFVFFSAPSALAVDFCDRSREDLLHDFRDPLNRVGFKNNGGLFNGGVCWWHSRLQRSAVYLSRFDPEQARPSQAEAQTIIRHLIRFDSVVLIPGYSNFRDFSSDYAELIQRELNLWQIKDGFINQEWARGIYGIPRMPADTLHARMDRIFERFKTSKPGLWMMAQIPGITSHALLLIGMDATDHGYDLKVIDSNHPETTRTLDYQYGDHAIDLGKDTFTPFLGFERDQMKIDRTLKAFCNHSVPKRTSAIPIDVVQVFKR